LWMALRGRWGITLKRRWLRAHWHTVRRLLRLGLPNFFETFGMWIGNFMVIVMVGWLGAQSAVEGKGNGLLGAHIIGVRIEAFSFLPGFAMGMAAATLAGQYIGAGSERMARAAVLRCAGVAAVVMGLIGGLFVAFPEPITAMLSDQPEHLTNTPALLVICGVVQVPFALAIVFRSAMRGAGDVKIVMMLTWISTYAIRLPMAYALSGVDIPLPNGTFIENPSPLDWGLSGLWIGLCGELILRGMIFSGRFFFGGWTRARV
ncbi:MAG: MATE family efflux transporter, partial [Phycisphaerales bacterium JB059]